MRLVRTALVVLLVSSSFGLHAKSFSSLEERMSQRDFESAGLQKLSDEELAFLNRWLHERGLKATADFALGAGTIDPTPPRNEHGDRLQSRLVGSFRGWSGNTVFRLENGQVWQQTGGGDFGGVNLESPSVTIEKGLLGAWYLRVEGYNSRAKVKRIE